MAIAIKDFATYNGSYVTSHTLPDIDCSGSDTYAVALGINRNPATEVTSWTFEGNTPDALNSKINTNVVAVEVKGDIVNDADLTIVSNTPTFKLQSMIGVSFTGVDQTTPVAATPTPPDAVFSNTHSTSYTGTSGNLILVFVSTQNDVTFTPIGCTEIASVTNPDSNLGSGFIGYVVADGTSQTVGGSWTGSMVANMCIVELTVASAGGQELSLPSIGSTSVLYTPTLLAQEISISLPLINNLAELYVPSLEANYQIATPYLENTSILTTPEIIRASVDITLPQIVNINVVYGQELIVKAVELDLVFINSDNYLNPPTIGVSNINISIPVLNNTSTLYSPELTASSVALNVSAISENNILFSPTLTVIGTGLTVPIIHNEQTLHSPSVIAGSTDITIPILENPNSIYSPNINASSVDVVLPYLTNTSVLYTPSIVIENILQIPLFINQNTLYHFEISLQSVSISIPSISSNVIMYSVGIVKRSPVQKVDEGVFINRNPRYIVHNGEIFHLRK